jgi:hypothetical protein
MSDLAGKQSRTETMSGPATIAGAVPGKHTLVEQVAPAEIQRRASGAADPDAGAVHAAAERGIATPATELPHGQRIQRAFGRHDVSGIQAHVGGDAAATARGMQADGYAAGNHVVLASADLATAAHEAAHVVQQRAGVQLKGGVGAAGDQHEQHADAVAARVTAGESAEDLLDAYAGAGGTPQVQHKTSIADTDKKAPAGQGPGILQSTDAASATHDHAVAFGGLQNGCGTRMEAWLYPDDDLAGSKPSVRPDWWAAMMADPSTDASWVSSYVVQGHLLNEHLGGPGNDMRNLTPFAKATNSQHHAYVEKAAKSIKSRKNIMRYLVVVDYASAPTSAWFGGKIPATFLVRFASGIKCVLQEYDAATRQPIGTEVTTTVTNAITGQG